MDKTVLILEDSKTQALIIGRMVEAQGWNVVHCNEVRDATESLTQMSVQVLFLDVFVGQYNSLLHIERFRKLAPHAPIVIMTAGNNREAIEDTLMNARRVGADYILRKPFTEILVKSVLDSLSVDAAAGERRKHVVVIDDSHTICTIARTALEGAGYRVSLANSMEEAFSNVDIAHVDLVLCDVFMPGMGGLKGMRTIKSVWPAVNMIAMSAGMENRVTDLQALSATRKVGVEAQLKKPFAPADLVHLANGLLGRFAAVPDRLTVEI